MIEQILKFSGGGTSKQRLREAEAVYRSAFANATPEARKEAEALVLTGRNYTSGNTATGRLNRLEQALIYEEATRLLRGLGRSPITMSTSRAIADFYSANQKDTLEGPGAAAPSTGIRQFYNYSPLKGLGMTSDADTLEDRVSGLAKTLLRNLEGAITAHNKQDLVEGLDMTLDHSSHRLLLELIITGLDNGNLSGREAYKKIGTIAGQLGVTDADKEVWEAYFGDLDDLEPWEVNYQKLTRGKKYKNVDLSQQDSWIAQTAEANGLKFLTDANGNIKAFDRNYNEYTGGELTLYNDDWSSDSNGLAIIIDAQGNVHIGNMNDLAGNQQNRFYKQYTKARQQNMATRDALWREHDYDYVFSKTDNPLFSQVSELRGQRKFKATDVSSLFSVGSHVVSVQGNGQQSALHDGYGNILFDDLTKFYVYEGDKVVEKTWQLMRPYYTHDSGESVDLMGSTMGLSGATLKDGETSITGHEDLAGRTAWGRMLAGGTAGAVGGGVMGGWLGAAIGGLGGLLGGALEYGFLHDIDQDPETFIKLVLDAKADPNAAPNSKYKVKGIASNKLLLHNLDWLNKQKDYITYIYNYVINNKGILDRLTPTLLKLFHLLIESYKQGGAIKKAAKGLVITADGQDITNELYGPKSSFHHLRKKNEKADKEEAKALERGFKSAYAMNANDEEVFGGDFKMTAADSMRLLTMAQDVASVVASFVPGAGTGVAAGLGVTSTATDLVADILDPAISGGQVAKNLAVNAGFAALGMVPGAKMGKVAKNVIKWAPRIISMAATAGIVFDESTLKTFSKIGDGTTSFTREDWKNISHVLSALAGTVKMGKGMYDGHKIKKSIIAKDNVELEGVKAKTANGEEVAMEIPKKTALDIDAKLKKAKTMEEAENVLREQKTSSGERMFTDDLIAAAIKQTTKEGAEPKAGDFKLVNTKKGSSDIDDVSYSKLREIWDQDAAVLSKLALTKEGQAAIWFANAFGGGAYGAKQRAILGNADVNNEKFINDYLGYDGWYNPMIDYRGIRNKAAGKSSLPASTSTDTPAPTPAPKYPSHILQDDVLVRPKQHAVYPGSDADGITPSSQAIVPYTGQRPVEDIALRTSAPGASKAIPGEAEIAPASRMLSAQSAPELVRSLLLQVRGLHELGIYRSLKEYDILVDIVNICKKSGYAVPRLILTYLSELSSMPGIRAQAPAHKTGGTLKYTHLRK